MLPFLIVSAIFAQVRSVATVYETVYVTTTVYVSPETPTPKRLAVVEMQSPGNKLPVDIVRKVSEPVFMDQSPGKSGQVQSVSQSPGNSGQVQSVKQSPEKSSQVQSANSGNVLYSGSGLGTYYYDITGKV